MLENQIVVVTGGAGLIGKEFVKAIIKNNGTAIIAEIDNLAGNNTLNKLKLELNTENIDFFQMDITSKESIKNAIVLILRKYNKIDGLINNAYPRNKNYGKHFFDVDYNDFKENLGMNLGGYFLTSQQFAKCFINQGFGNIINISSIYGVVAPRFEIYDGTPMTTPVEYAAIKSGLIHLTKYMAKYFKGKNIQVNSISVGGIFDHQPESFLEKYKEFCLNKGMLSVKDISGTLIFLLSSNSNYINGQNIIVDDGFVL